MKLTKTCILLFLFIINEITFSQNVLFLFIGKPGGDYKKMPKLSSGLNDIFLTDVAQALLEELPCVDVSDPKAIENCLAELRLQSTPEFGKRDVVPIIKNISNAIANGYKVRYSIYPVSDKMVRAEIRCEDKKANVLFDFSVEMNIKEFTTLNRIRLSEMFVEKLSKYEICPFKGEIIVKVVSKLKDEQIEQYPVYCNKLDGVYSKIVSTDNYTESEWKITKTGKNSADGTMKIKISEKFTVDEINPCYTCSPDKQGSRNYKSETTTTADISGISKESESYGVKVDDARAILTFLDDGTYFLRVKAASKKGNKKTINTVTSQGICDNLNSPPKKTTNKIDAGINELFGPITGTARDKVLSHSETITRTNPISGELETITYEFNLTRE
jgi:hypothetical protein